jgi:hypothetical protein
MTKRRFSIWAVSRDIAPHLSCRGCAANLATAAGVVAHNEGAAKHGERSYRGAYERGVVLAGITDALGYNPAYLVQTRVRQ